MICPVTNKDCKLCCIPSIREDKYSSMTYECLKQDAVYIGKTNYESAKKSFKETKLITKKN